MTRLKPTLTPRKTPVQARSTHTVDAIFEACIQVLTDVGGQRFNTTRVAERAGVSVGTLYQYFPHKQALLAAVLERHLSKVVDAVAQACSLVKGQTTEVMAQAIVAAFVSAKFAQPDASRALYAVAAEVGGTELVARLTQRAQLNLCELLATASDFRFDELTTVSYVLSTAVIGPVQGLLVSQASPAVVNAVGKHLAAMVSAYLAAIGSGAKR